jgi:ribosomal protein S18 acetylase RimI-like enzyme
MPTGHVPKSRPSEPAIRPATIADVPTLVELENRTFTGDRLSARSFRHLIRHGGAAMLVEEMGGVIRGYAVVFFRRGTSVARLYSFAVAPEHRGQGLAKALLLASERVARARGAAALRLEVHKENAGAQALYRKAGYRDFGILRDYYEDGGDAVRMEKPLDAQEDGRPPDSQKSTAHPQSRDDRTRRTRY